MRKKPSPCFRAAVLALAIAAAVAREGTADADPSLVIVVEGLRDEYVTRSLMPNLRSLAKNGTQFESHYAVFPAASAVNAASIATGSYPAKHGILNGTGGELVTAPTLGEILAGHRKRMLVIGAGSEGAPRLLAPSGAGESYLFMPPADGDSSGNEHNAWVVSAYLDTGLDRFKPDVTVLWLAEPGGAPQTPRIDAPWTKRAARALDDQIGEILKRHKKLNLNIFVASDPGPPRGESEAWLRGALVEAGLKAAWDSEDAVVLADHSVYVAGHDRVKIREIVQWLQRQERVGPIYTQQARPTHPEGFVRGALSLQAVYLDHERAPDIFFELAEGEQAGMSSASGLGALLIASGPGIKERMTSAVPSANYDLAPTLLTLAGIAPPESMDGRVLEEALRGGPDPDSVAVLRRRHGSEAKWEGGGYRLMMTELGVGGTDYFDSTSLSRGVR